MSTITQMADRSPQKSTKRQAVAEYYENEENHSMHNESHDENRRAGEYAVYICLDNITVKFCSEICTLACIDHHSI